MTEFIANQEISLQALQAGDRSEFARLVDAFSPQIYRLALKMLGDEQDAEDVLQNTFMKALQAIGKFEGRSSLSTWLYRIARNKVYQQLRRKKRLSKLDAEAVVVNDVEDDAFSVEDVAKVHRCLKELIPEYKEVLILRFLEQMSYRQISHVVNCSLGTVKSRIYYAKLALKAKMEA